MVYGSVSVCLHWLSQHVARDRLLLSLAVEQHTNFFFFFL